MQNYFMRLNFVIVFILIQMVNAQDFIITGKVFSEGKPLQSASVFVMDTNTGVTTNKEGQFSIYISNIANPRLVISYLGYKSQIKSIRSETTDLGIIELEWDNKLEEVVVSGTLNLYPNTTVLYQLKYMVKIFSKPIPPLRFLRRWKM